MKRLYKLFFLCILIGFSNPVVVFADNLSENEKLMQRAEQLLLDYKESEALQLYEQVIAVAGTNYEALCRASLLHCRIGERYSDDSHKLDHFSKARSYAQKAYDLKPQDSEANYLMALSIANQAMISGPTERLIGINVIKSFLDAALENNEQHAGAWHLLGRWYFKMANLNFAEKAAAKVLFGGVCEMASNQDAALAMENAIAFERDNIQYYFDLANIYAELEDTQAYKSTLEQALTLNLRTKEELELSRRCKIMLQRI